MNILPKVVFSRTLRKVEWHNARLAKDRIAEEILKLKQQRGRDLALLGSSNLAVSFLQRGLIDEFRIMMSPVVLGKGKVLFEGVDHKLNLKLVTTRKFVSGSVMLCYQPAK